MAKIRNPIIVGSGKENLDTELNTQDILLTNLETVVNDLGGGGYPIEIDDPNDMTALLVAANVDKVYLYTGTTTQDYINGDLYVVESQPVLEAYATAQSGVTYTAVTDLSNYTDEQINAISKAISNCADITNSTQTVYLSDGTSISIGATRSYTLSTQEAVTDRVLGFNHDTLTSSTAYGEATATGKAGMTWQNVDCLATRYPMNDTNTNAGGWTGSKMRTSTLPTIKALLPSDLQAVIKLVDKKAANGGSSNYSATVTSSDDLFLLCENEIFGTITYAQDGSNEGTQYEYWVGKSVSDRIKYYDNAGTPTATYWWERSSNSSNTGNFCNVNTSGNVNHNSASNTRGVAFAYCT